MEDRSRFSDSLLDDIRRDNFDGRSIVNACRSILLVDYNDNEYGEDFFSTFNLIVDESSDKDVDYGAIEELYKEIFLSALSEFRAFYGI